MNKLTLKKVGWSLGAVGALAIAAACSSGGGGGGGGDGGINCGTGSTQCGDTCTVIARDTQNCGACGKACAATELCSAGTCVPAAGGCTMGTTKCGTECVDTKTDDRNCGMCGTKCGANKVCMAGACADNCAMGTTKCGNSCVDQQTDRTNCGGCGTTCKDGEICSAGKCAISCQQGLTKCSAPVADGGVADAAADASGDGGAQFTGDYCANLQTDNANCGQCGNACGFGKKCIAGQCSSSIPVADCNELNAKPTVWGKACTGFDLRARTKSTLHFLGCVDSESCTFYCTYDAQTQKLSFGTKGANALRAQVDPGNAAGDSFAVGTYACATAQTPNSVCNGFDSNNNGVAVNGIQSLCNALGYKAGTVVRQATTNSCPQAHSLDGTGTNWTSDFVQDSAWGAEYQCTGFQ